MKSPGAFTVRSLGYRFLGLNAALLLFLLFLLSMRPLLFNTLPIVLSLVLKSVFLLSRTLILYLLQLGYCLRTTIMADSSSLLTVGSRTLFGLRDLSLRPMAPSSL